MELNEILNTRRSIRKFKIDHVPDHLINEVVDAGRLAPSGLNIQPWRYTIVKSSEKKSMLSKAISSKHAAQAPVLILCSVDMRTYAEIPERMKELIISGAISEMPQENSSENDAFRNEVWMKANSAMNLGISVGYMTLKAVDLGLGSCWLGAFDEKEIKKSAGLDDNFSVFAILALGYPDESPDPRPRLPLDKIILDQL